jgi:O-antigen/teichoic acid export membrane protein
MSSEIVSRLRRGTLVAYGGGVVALATAFFGRIVATRSVTAEEFGRYASALAIFGFTAGLCELAMHDGVARNVALYLAKKDQMRASSVIASALRLTLGCSVAAALVLVSTSDFIGTLLFGAVRLAGQHWVLWSALPFFVLSDILGAAFIGSGRVELKILFIDVLRTGLFPAFVLTALWPSGAVSPLIWPFAAAVIVASVGLIGCAVCLLWRRGPSVPMTRELLAYSLPLFGSGIVGSLVNVGNPVLLGALYSPRAVAFYSVAWPLSALVPLGLASLEPSFLQTFSGLYVQGRSTEMRVLYQKLTRWVFLAGMPVALLLLLAPRLVLSVLFGVDYAAADTTLRLLVIGMLLQLATGPNDAGLKVAGRTPEIMVIRLAGTVVNFGLLFFFLPRWGSAGAAASLSLSIAVTNTLFSWRLYRATGIQPFDRLQVGVVLGSAVVVVLAWGMAP